MKTTVIGTDYGGLVTGACLADTLIIVTARRAFKSLDFSVVKPFLKNLIIFNGRKLSC